TNALCLSTTRHMLVCSQNCTTTPESHLLSLHDALPISLLGNPDQHDRLAVRHESQAHDRAFGVEADDDVDGLAGVTVRVDELRRSEEHTSELQSRENLVCRLLLEKKKKKTNESPH